MTQDQEENLKDALLTARSLKDGHDVIMAPAEWRKRFVTLADALAEKERELAEARQACLGWAHKNDKAEAALKEKDAALNHSAFCEERAKQDRNKAEAALSEAKEALGVVVKVLTEMVKEIGYHHTSPVGRPYMEHEEVDECAAMELAEKTLAHPLVIKYTEQPK